MKKKSSPEKYYLFIERQGDLSSVQSLNADEINVLIDKSLQEDPTKYDKFYIVINGEVILFGGKIAMDIIKWTTGDLDEVDNDNNNDPVHGLYDGV